MNGDELEEVLRSIRSAAAAASDQELEFLIDSLEPQATSENSQLMVIAIEQELIKRLSLKRLYQGMHEQ